MPSLERLPNIVRDGSPSCSNHEKGSSAPPHAKPELARSNTQGWGGFLKRARNRSDTSDTIGSTSGAGEMLEERCSWTGAQKLVRELEDTVLSVAISDDDGMFAASCSNGRVEMFSTANGSSVAKIRFATAVNAIKLLGR